MITGTQTPQHEPLNPVALDLGFIEIAWYGLILGSAAFVGLLLAIREGKRHGAHPDVFMDLLLFALPVAIIGARLYYVIFEWDYYAQHPEHIIAVWRGGLAIHGALIGSVITAIWYAKSRGFSFWKMLDIGAPSVLIGQAIGRWGNFMNQEAHGGVLSTKAYEFLNAILPNWMMNQMEIYTDEPGGSLDPGY